MDIQQIYNLWIQVIEDHLFESLNIDTISSIESDLRKVIPDSLLVKMNRKLKPITKKTRYKNGSISLCCEVGTDLYEIGRIDKADFLGETSYKFIVADAATTFRIEKN